MTDNTQMSRYPNFSQTIVRKSKSFFRRAMASVYRTTINGISVFDPKRISSVLLQPAEQFAMPDLVDVDGITHPEFESCVREVPAMHLFSIERGKCITEREEIFTSDDSVAVELTPLKQNPMLGQPRSALANPVQIHGIVANLTLSGLENNYYHCMVEHFARLHLLAISGVKPDWFICRSEMPFQRELLKRFGVTEDKILNLDRGVAVQADILVAPSLINNWEYRLFRNVRHFQKQWLPKWLKVAYAQHRERYRDLPDANRKRIYISRNDADYRKLVNEEEVVEMLSSLGFERLLLSQMKITEQVAAFRNAECVIGVHGSGFTNMLFCENPKVTLLEIYPEFYPDSAFRIQAQILGLNWHYLMGDTMQPDSRGPLKDDVFVNVDRLRSVVVKLLE